MTKIEIRRFRPEDLVLINTRPEQETLISQYHTPRQLDDYGIALVAISDQDRKGARAWTGITDGEIAICSGIGKNPYGVCEAWAIVGKKFNMCYKSYIKKMKNEILKTNAARIQAICDYDFDQAKRFLEYLGFEKEGVLRKYGVAGKDQVMLSIIKE